MVNVAEIASVLSLDISTDSGKLEWSKGTFILRTEYFWRPHLDPEKFFYNRLAKLQAAYGEPNVEVIEYGDKWQSFKGGKGVKHNAHYFMRFKVAKPQGAKRAC